MVSADNNTCRGIGRRPESMELIDPNDVNGGILLKMGTIEDQVYNDRGAEIALLCHPGTTTVYNVSATKKSIQRPDPVVLIIYRFNMKSRHACFGYEDTWSRTGENSTILLLVMCSLVSMPLLVPFFVRVLWWLYSVVENRSE